MRPVFQTSFHPFPLKLLLKSPYPHHCTNCTFDLHPSCALLPRDPLCSLHPHRHRTFQGKSYVYDVCLDFGGELDFRCDKCDFNIHPKCLKSLFPPGFSSGTPPPPQIHHYLPFPYNSHYKLEIFHISQDVEQQGLEFRPWLTLVLLCLQFQRRKQE
jgi:hypothetical protein